MDRHFFDLEVEFNFHFRKMALTRAKIETKIINQEEYSDESLMLLHVTTNKLEEEVNRQKSTTEWFENHTGTHLKGWVTFYPSKMVRVARKILLDRLFFFENNNKIGNAFAEAVSNILDHLARRYDILDEMVKDLAANREEDVE